ncbi:MAG: sulfatase-like hydrolase/transferase [Thermomicrobiales bacterium]
MELEPKNLLFIMSDQHSPHVLGCYGNRIVQTPNIDALAATGTRFAHAYTPTPICVPARASFATGRYAHTIDAWDNAKPYIGTEAPSWGHRLTAQGHQVVTVGKLHYRQVQDPSGFPDQRLPMHVLDGIGDLYALLRGEMPVRPQSRQHVLDARAGESEYIRYDRAIAHESARFLREEATGQGKPWALFVSFVTPHFPLIAPDRFFDLYPPESLPWPIQGAPEEWPDHPAIRRHRADQTLDEPLDEAAIRNAMAAYYGMVTFLDEQIGLVLQALDDAGPRVDTRIIYTSDHGEMLGEHGLWWKSSMYEASVSVPLILAGPDVPVAHVVTTNTSLVDCFPTIVEGVGGDLLAEDGDLPGTSLWQLAARPDQDRTVFSEYHTVFSPSAMYMIRNGRYKYIHYVEHPPMLFDLQEDPDELTNLANDPAHATVLAARETELRAIVDPERIDRRAKNDQQRRLDAAGGAAAVMAGGVKIPYTPAPRAFDPAPVAVRDRATRLQD